MLNNWEIDNIKIKEYKGVIIFNKSFILSIIY